MTTTSDGKLARVKEAKHEPHSFTICSEDLPAIKEWKVGKKYSMELEVEMVAISKGEMYGMEPSGGRKEKEHEARFKILSIDSEPEEEESEGK